MSEETKVKQDLLNLANDLGTAEGVIVLKGINTGSSDDLDVLKYDINPLLAIPALLSLVSDVYESSLSSMEFGFAKGEFSKEELKDMDSSINEMLLRFNSLTQDLYEESLERRKVIALKGIGSKEVEKEEK
jgi:hypothetical protein